MHTTPWNRCSPPIWTASSMRGAANVSRHTWRHARSVPGSWLICRPTTTRYSYTRTPSVTWGWGALTLGAMLLPLTNMALVAQGYRLSGESIGKNASAATLGAGILVSPWLTAHELGADHLVIRQGLNFHGQIAYGNIAAVYATERKPTHFPIALYRHTLFVALWPVS